MPRKSQYSDEFKKKLVKDHLSGISAHELSKKYNITITSIYQWKNFYTLLLENGSLITAEDYTNLQAQMNQLQEKNNNLRKEIEHLQEKVNVQKENSINTFTIEINKLRNGDKEIKLSEYGFSNTVRISKNISRNY